MSGDSDKGVKYSVEETLNNKHTHSNSGKGRAASPCPCLNSTKVEFFRNDIMVRMK